MTRYKMDLSRNRFKIQQKIKILFNNWKKWWITATLVNNSDKRFFYKLNTDLFITRKRCSLLLHNKRNHTKINNYQKRRKEMAEQNDIITFTKIQTIFSSFRFFYWLLLFIAIYMQKIKRKKIKFKFFT